MIPPVTSGSASPHPRRSLVIPAYNEAKRIGALFDAIGGFDGELIVVCDGNDETADIVKEIGRRRPELTIRCLVFPERLGKGGGVLEGLRVARAPLVGFADADGSTGIDEMERLFAGLSGCDGAIGSRWMDGSHLEARQGFFRRLESRVFNLLIRSLFGLRYHDTQCGAKVFRKTAIDEVLPQMVSRGFEFDVELLWRLNRKGYTVREFPIVWQNKSDSHVRKSDMARMMWGLLRVRFGPGTV